jgi:hypothetical protein
MSKTPKTIVTTAALVAMLLGLAPPRAEADWDNQSGSLPGMSSGKTIAIVGAAAGGVVAYYLLKKKSRKDKAPDPAATGDAGAKSIVPSHEFVRELRSNPQFARLLSHGGANR